MRAGRQPSSRSPLKQACHNNEVARSRQTLRPNAAQEKLHRAPHPVGELVRPGQIHRPLPHHRVVEPFHELRQMHHRKRVRNFASLLPLRQNFPQQTGGSLLVPPQFYRSHRIHGARQYHRLPQLPVGFHLPRQGYVQPPQTLARPRLARKLRTQPLADTGKPAFSHLAQNRILTGKIPEKGGLADFEHLHDVVDSGVLVSVLAKQLDRSIDNLLPQARLLPLPKPDLDLFSRCLCCPTPCRKRTWQGLFLLASITGTSPPATSVKCEINYNKIATNVKLSKREG